MAMALEIEIEAINQFEFYNTFIQFEHPVLVLKGENQNIEDHNNDNDNEDGDGDVQIANDAMNGNQEESKEPPQIIEHSLYNSTTFMMDDIDDVDKVKSLVFDLRDQGAEYFKKLLIIIQNENEEDNIDADAIKRFCESIATQSTSIKTFCIFDDADNNFIETHKILTSEWYTVFQSDHNNQGHIGFPSIPSQIEDNLFLGGLITAKNLFVLKSLNISMVINCSKDLENYFESDGIKYHRISIDDVCNENISEHLKECCTLLDTYIGKGDGNVLVHCQQGKSRSVSVVVYYLMQNHGWGVQEALKYVKNLRNIASPNEGFMAQLNQLHLAKGKDNL